MIRSPARRAIGLVLATVLVLTLGTPAAAEANVLGALAIGGLVAVGVVLIAYLVIANVADLRQAHEAGPVRVACAGAGCADVPTPGSAVASPANGQAP
jgi:Na+/serine symporter